MKIVYTGEYTLADYIVLILIIVCAYLLWRNKNNGK